MGDETTRDAILPGSTVSPCKKENALIDVCRTEPERRGEKPSFPGIWLDSRLLATVDGCPIVE